MRSSLRPALRSSLRSSLRIRPIRSAHVFAAALGLSAAAVALSGSAAHAAGTILFAQVGSNVTATASGSFDLTALTLNGNSGQPAYVFPFSGQIFLGPTTSTNASFYSGISGPTSFGVGGPPTVASSGSGNTVGVLGPQQLLIVPVGYVSGTALSATDIFNNTTLASMSLTTGTYTWTWGTGAHADSLTVYVGTTPPSAAAPEPGSLALLSFSALPLMGLVGTVGKVGGRVRRRKAH